MVPEIVDSKRRGRKQRDRKDCQTFLDPRVLRRTSNVLQMLYDAVKLDARRPQHQVLMLDHPPRPFAIAARIWLGLSIIQLWRREDWETELGLDGREIAKPSFKLFQMILDEEDDGHRRDIYIC